MKVFYKILHELREILFELQMIHVILQDIGEDVAKE